MPRQRGFIGTSDANFTDFAVKCTRIYMLGIFTAGFQVVSTSYFQSTGQPMKASLYCPCCGS
ncbi:MAG: hypothetical protein RHS_1916 [Robinsoniella sp. RHS]|nr:MAG: hypothetical protein RHS_1916 [Robinsoniella sp. RHS]